MARLIPKIAPEDISNVGERDVAIALVEQLPNECIVYHSFPLFDFARLRLAARGRRPLACLP